MATPSRESIRPASKAALSWAAAHQMYAAAWKITGAGSVVSRTARSAK